MPDPTANPAQAEHAPKAGAEAKPADGHGHAAGHAAHDPFSIKAAMLHHNMPYPAWEITHGKPLITFDLGTYAAINLHSIKAHHADEFAKADPVFHKLEAELVVARKDFRFGENLDATEVAKAMTVAASHSGLVFPSALSWVNQQIFFGGVALIGLFLLFGVLFRRKADQVRPVGRMQHAIESIVIYLRDGVVKPAMHERATAWTPFFVSMFLMILAVNLMGLIPGTGTLSGNIGVTAGFAVVVFLSMLFFGMKEQGPKYWVTLVPIHFTLAMSPIWLLLLVIELLGLVIKPFALAVRLFANMFAGHTVLLVFLSLGYVVLAQSAGSSEPPTALAGGMGIFGFVMATAFHAMEILVAFIQAYIFTMLSAMFIGASIHPEH